MTTETTADSGNRTSPTNSQASTLATGIAAAQTAYALNNGGGLRLGEPLRMIEDSALINGAGARPLNVSIPDGYVVHGIYQDQKTGLDAFFAVNFSSRKLMVGVAGTNGFGIDQPDTAEDVLNLGTAQMRQLIRDKNFRSDFSSAVEAIGGVEKVDEFLIAGQSLGGGNAPILGAYVVYGDPRTLKSESILGLGLRPYQVSTVSINGFGTSYSLGIAGFSEKDIAEYNQEANQQSIAVRNSVTGAIDFVSQTGGSRGGLIWGLDVREETSLGGLHRMNYGVGEGLALIDGDLTKLTPITIPSLSHESISNNLNRLNNTIPIANNGLSLTWAGYVSVLFSKPGESAAGVSLGLQSYLGISKPLADVLGGAGELLMRALPFARAAQVMQLLVGGYTAGQVIGSQTASEVNFPELQSGWIRTNLTPMGSEPYLQGWRFSLDTNSITGVQVVRSGGGFTQEVHPDGTIIYTHPQFGIGVFNSDGSGTLHLKELDPKTGETLGSHVSFEANTHIEMTADGWRIVKPLDTNGERVQLTYYTGIKSTVYEGSYNNVDKEGKTNRIFSIDNVRHENLATDFSLPDEKLSWTITQSSLGNGHTLTVTRDDDRRVVEVVEEKIIGTGRRLITTSDGSGTVQGTRREETLNDKTSRIITSGENGKLLETSVSQIYKSGNETFVLDDVINHEDNTRVLTVRDVNGNIVKSEAISVDAAPLQMTDKARDQMNLDVVDFITALRQKDKAGVIISSARLVLDYARTQGVVSPAYENMVGDASSALNLVGSLRALGSGDTLAQLGGAVGLLNSTNYFAARLAGTSTGYLSATQTAALSTIGAVLSIANLANLGKMIDNKQFGSAAASVVSAVNAVGYLSSASTSLMGAKALIAINPVVMIVAAIVIDEFMAEATEPPPPPPQGLATIVRESNGKLGFRITESNEIGEHILSAQLQLLLPKLEVQLNEANQGVNNPDHALTLIAARMPLVRLSGWPSFDNNGINNYFFVLEQTDPMKDDPNLIGVARQDLVSLYAETLILPEALAQQWEVDHLQSKFGQDEMLWQTEGEWLRGRSPIEKQRAQLQQEIDSSTARWKSHAILHLVLSSWNSNDSQSGNLALLNPAQKIEQADRLRMEDAQAALAAFEAIHPLDQREAARATPQQELDFARNHAAREVVSLQWLNIITVDLGGDGVAIKDLPGNVGTDLDSLRQQHVARFDVDGDGFLEATQWIAPTEAMLGIDRSGNGLIDNGSELFNGADTPFDQHGLAALAYYDANGDGRITADDPVYQQLRLWVDLDCDGSAGALEVFDMRMHSALSGTSGSVNDALAGMAVSAIDLNTMTMQFADGSSAPLTNTALLSHTKGLQIVMDEASANLNVLHEDGLRENFITLVQDMSALLELQSASLSNTRRAELEALAKNYGLNPASQDFMSMVQSLRATGETVGQQDTVIYFGDEDVWVDPDVRLRLEQMRISFRKLGDGSNVNIAGDSQLGRFGAALDTQSIATTSTFNDRWVPSQKLLASDVVSDAHVVANNNDTQAEQWILPTDIYSLLQVVKGAQLGGLVTQRAVIASNSEHPDQAPQTVQIFSTAQPLGKLAAAELVANEDSIIAFSYAQLEQQARALLTATDPLATVQLLGIRSAHYGFIRMDDASKQLSFQLQQDYTGNAGFTYVVMDQKGRVLERDVSISLRAVNDAPHVVGESIRSKEDIPLLIDAAMLLANDSDPEGDALIITGIGRTGFGRAELLGNGQIHYTPPSDQYGITDTVEYIVQDTHGASSTGKISITLDAVDDAPSVVSERIINAREDQTLRIASRLLLWNDFDVDTDARTGATPLTISAVGSAEHGKVTLDPTGEVVFVPDANYNGAASFSYTVKDETGLFTTGRSQLRIDAVNDAPLTAGEQIASKEDERLIIDPALLLINELDADIVRGEKQTLAIVAVDMAIGGQVQMKDGLILFMPDANRNGQASFRYTVSDGAGGFAQAQANVQLAAVNDAPIVPAKKFTAVEDTILAIPIELLLEGVTDVDSAVFHLQTIGNAVGGTVELVNGQVLFRPTANFYGSAGFEYAVADEEGACSTAMAAVDINNVNDAPAFISGSKFEPVGEEDQEIRISESALVKMFWDADGDVVQLASLTLRALNAGDSVRFDATRRELVFRGAANANGMRQISFAMTDGMAPSAMQTLNINLHPVNDAPVVNAIGFQMLEDGGQTDPSQTAFSYLSYDLLLSGAVDPDGDLLKISAVANGRTVNTQQTTAVTVLNDAVNKRVVIAAPLNYNGAIEFEFSVQDDKGLATTQKAYGVVVPVNDAPSLTVQQTSIVIRPFIFGSSATTLESWTISAWDPDANQTVNFAIERNPLRGAVTLGTTVSNPDSAGGVRAIATLNTTSGFGNVLTVESAWVSATDTAGAKSLINIAMTGRYKVDPIVIDLGQDGLSFIDIAKSKVAFDTNGDGVLRRSAWIGATDAVLAWDHDQNGVINRQDEIAFSSHLDPRFAGLSDLQALQQPEFDQNQDGVFNALDAKWQQFRLWQDLNSDGVSQEGELQTLQQADIQNLFLAANVLNRAEGPDVRVRGYTRLEMTDGRLLQAADVWLNQEGDSGADNTAPDPTAQQVTLLGADQLQSLLEQLAKTPTGSNHAPILYGTIPTQYAEEGRTFRVDIAPNMFIDPDVGDKLGFTARKADGSPLPDWLRFDAERLRFEGKPTADDAGSFEIILTTTDSTQARTVTSFFLIATQINHAPQLNHTLNLITWVPGADNETQLPQDLFKDQNKDDALSIVASLADQSAIPDWLVFDPVTLTLHGNPTAEQLAAPLTLAFTATDWGGLSCTTTTTLAASHTGAAGNDIYLFNNSSGNIVITEKSGSADEVNIINFVDGLSFDQIEFSRNLEAVHIRSNKALAELTNSTSQFMIENPYRTDSWNPAQEIRLTDGKVVTDFVAMEPAFKEALTSDIGDFYMADGGNITGGGIDNFKSGFYGVPVDALVGSTALSVLSSSNSTVSLSIFSG